MAQALGAQLLDEAGKPIGWGGGELARLARIELSGMDPRLAKLVATSGSLVESESDKRAACRHDAKLRCEAACDVTNPLVGPRGAARVYGPQKGATPAMVERLDAGLAHLAEVIERDLGVSVRDVAGAGAAGGLGAGLMAFLGAKLRPGVELVIQAVRLEEKLRDADLVIVGEGRMDAQTAYGKVPVGVARVASRMGIPVVAIVGSLGEGYEAVHGEGIVACFSILDRPMSLEQAFARAKELLSRTAEEVVRLFLNRQSEIGNRK
jgi:glycerate kinase